MTKRTLFVCLATASLLGLASCGSSRSFVPQATNMIKTVTLDEMNLTGKDYEVTNRIEASATIKVTLSGSNYSVEDPEGTFRLDFSKDKKSGEMILSKFRGVVRVGYLSRKLESFSLNAPDEIAHRMAIYRIINLVKEQGGDGIIEPVISTTAEEIPGGLFGSSSIVYNCTVSGKVFRLKNSK